MLAQRLHAALLAALPPDSTASTASSSSDLFVLLALLALPSLTFWTLSTVLHLAGANASYSGQVPLSTMLLSQLRIDVLQIASGIPRLFLEPHTRHLLLRPSRLVLGVICIDVVEYACHRAMHSSRFPLLRAWHKRHHTLVSLHTFGTYLNSAGEALFTGSILGVTLVGVCGLSVLELALTTAFATAFTTFDHCPSSFWGVQSVTPSHHEIHHNVNSECNFSQPFSPFLDYAFGTRHVDVMAKKQRRIKNASKAAKGGAHQ
jgi:sterol desaturase/sphingolipid hydroxylase (fatty acid hydroxylase superfamily)